MKKGLLVFLLLAFAGKSFATHIRAGEITYRNISGLTYEATVTTYVKKSSNIIREKLHVDWGDNTALDVNITDSTLFGNDTEMRTYVGTHTYANAGTYPISVSDQNRNGGILNIPNSINTPFYIESRLYIDNANSANNSVQFLAPPIMKAQVNTLFSNSVSSYDPDADYLTYRLIPCRDASNHNIAGYSIPTGFSINSISGTITWNTPQMIGEYNFAVEISKWKNGKIMGNVVRDFQVTVSAPTPIRTVFIAIGGPPWVKDSTGNYTFTIAPNDSILLHFSYNDSSNNVTGLVPYSETLINGNTAVVNKTPVGTSAITVVYKWKPANGNARCAPYLVTFRGASVYNSTTFETDLAALIYVRDQNTQNCTAPAASVAEITQAANAHKIKVYPNPVIAASTITLTGTISSSVHQFMLLDIMGREVQKTQFYGNNFIFDKGTLSKGIYLYHITTAKEETYTGKLLIE